MKFAVLAAISLLASVASAFHIVPPSSITACDPLTVEYDTTTGEAPFSLAFHNGTADGVVLAAFTDVTGTSYTWGAVTIPAGTSVVIALSDSSGLGSYTSPITVSAGSSDTCLGNATSIPTIPTITTTHPPTSTYGGSPTPSSLNTTTTTTTTTSSSTSSSSGLSSSNSRLSSSISELSSSISSLSSHLSVASSELSSLTGSTSSSKPSSTGGLSTSGGVVNVASVFTIGFSTVVMAAFLA